MKRSALACVLLGVGSLATLLSCGRGERAAGDAGGGSASAGSARAGSARPGSAQHEAHAPGAAAAAASDAWSLGEPDLVLALDRPYSLEPGERDVFRNFVVRVPLTERRFVRAVEFRPDPAEVVHHAVLLMDSTPASRRLDEADPAPGYEGGMLERGGAHSPAGRFIGWTPGQRTSESPTDLAWPLEPGTDLVLQLHLRPRAARIDFSARIGFHFAPGPPTRFATALRLGSETIDIPAGERRYVVTDSLRLPVDVELLGLYPHAHYLARAMTATAEVPGSRRERLLDIRHWDFDHQQEHRLEPPLLLPAGTLLRMRYVYDNSGVRAPTPGRPRRVRFGPSSAHEMGDLWVHVAVPDSAAHQRLRRLVLNKNLQLRSAGLERVVRERPDSAAAHHDLGNVRLLQGRPAEAITHYGEALRLQPGGALTHYQLGVALQTEARFAGAVTEYREALRIEPELVEAAYNLGTALLALGQPQPATDVLRQALAREPEHAAAHQALGVALVRAGTPEPALEHLREAARLRPDWPAPHLELAWTVATHPGLRRRPVSEALAAARRASELTGHRDPLALQVLAAAHAAAGEYDQALAQAEIAVRLARLRGEASLLRALREQAESYRAGRPYLAPATPVPSSAP